VSSSFPVIIEYRRNYKNNQNTEQERKKRDNMATDILDEHRFQSQCSLYESTRIQLTKDSILRPNTATTTTSSTTVLGAPPMSTVTHHRRVKYSTQANASSSPSSTNSIHSRHSGSTDIFSLIRSFAMKPFKTSSMSNAIAEGQTSNVIGGTNTPTKSSVNLLRYRPLSDVLTDHASYTQSTHVCIDRQTCVHTYISKLFSFDTNRNLSCSLSIQCQ
jgi:hypothetical protein